VGLFAEQTKPKSGPTTKVLCRGDILSLSNYAVSFSNPFESPESASEMNTGVAYSSALVVQAKK